MQNQMRSFVPEQAAQQQCLESVRRQRKWQQCKQLKRPRHHQSQTIGQCHSPGCGSAARPCRGWRALPRIPPGPSTATPYNHLTCLDVAAGSAGAGGGRPRLESLLVPAGSDGLLAAGLEGAVRDFLPHHIPAQKPWRQAQCNKLAQNCKLSSRESRAQAKLVSTCNNIRSMLLGALRDACGTPLL